MKSVSWAGYSVKGIGASVWPGLVVFHVLSWCVPLLVVSDKFPYRIDLSKEGLYMRTTSNRIIRYLENNGKQWMWAMYGIHVQPGGVHCKGKSNYQGSSVETPAPLPPPLLSLSLLLSPSRTLTSLSLLQDERWLLPNLSAWIRKPDTDCIVVLK